MAGTYLGYPFDPEIFLLNWMTEIDPAKTALLDSGVMVNNATIKRMIANGSNQYTMPFYNVLTGKDDNYDGVTDMTVSEPDGSSQTGVVYGRMHAWRDRDFIHDFNSGANPTIQISRQVAKYWHKRRQARLIGILNGIFGIGGTYRARRARETEGEEAPVSVNTAKKTRLLANNGPQEDENYYHNGDWTEDWKLHTYDISTSGARAEGNVVSEATAAEAAQQALGDAQDLFSIVIMHSAVALSLAKKNLLEYRKYTNAAGITSQINIADWNGYTVIVDDGVPVEGGVYTTYLMGRGGLHYAPAPVKTPVETSRVVLENGGYDLLATRFRETIHPNGFSFTLPANCISPTDEQLATTANWKVAFNPKAIPIARILSNG